MDILHCCVLTNCNPIRFAFHCLTRFVTMIFLPTASKAACEPGICSVCSWLDPYVS